MAISKRLLIHNCELLRSTGVDRFGNSTTESYKLENVRIDTVQGQTINNVGETKTDRLVLFFDTKNSSPAGFVPKITDKIIWNNNEFEIRTISEKYAMSKDPHHYEAELV